MSGPFDAEGVPRPPAEAGRTPPRLPAVEWLDDFAGRLPSTTRLILIFPPLHVLGQPARGSRDAADDELCKAKIVAGMSGRRATVVDYRWRSDLNGRDENFWDRLHYRLPIAARIVDDLEAIVGGAAVPAGAPYRVPLPAR